MHEYPITQEIIKIAEDLSKKNGGGKVKEITIVAGDYSGYIAESIQLYFDIISQGTVCENTNLIIKNVKPMLRCQTCKELFERKPFSFACPMCQGEGVPTEIGREFYVESIEMDG